MTKLAHGEFRRFGKHHSKKAANERELATRHVDHRQHYAAHHIASLRVPLLRYTWNSKPEFPIAPSGRLIGIKVKSTKLDVNLLFVLFRTVSRVSRAPLGGGPGDPSVRRRFRELFRAFRELFRVRVINFRINSKVNLT